MKNPFAGRPTIKITTGQGGAAGVPLAKKDLARGLTPGSGQGGTANLPSHAPATVAAAAKAGRPSVPGKREPASGKPVASNNPGLVFGKGRGY
jgi:hypothetical protein